MPLVEALGRIDQLATQVAALRPSRADASSASRFGTELAAQVSASSAVGASSLGSTSVTGEAIVAKAKEYVGVPYVLGGNDKSGIDCSGLVQQVLGELGIDVPRRVSQQQSVGVEVPSLAEAQPGDLIVTNNADHVVIYAGDGMIVHAPYPGRTVSYQKNYLDESEIQTIRRVVPEASAAAGPAVGVQAGSSGLAGAAGAAELSALLGLGGLSGLRALSGLGGLSGLGALSALAGFSGSSAPAGLSGSSAVAGSDAAALSALSAFTGGNAGTAGTSNQLRDLVLAAQVQALLRSRS